MCLSVYVISCMVSSCMLSGCVLSCVVSIFVTLGKVRRFVNMLSRNALLRSVTSSLHAIAVRAISQRPRFLFDYLQLYMALFRITDRSIPDECTLQIKHSADGVCTFGKLRRLVYVLYTNSVRYRVKNSFPAFDNTQKRTTCRCAPSRDKCDIYPKAHIVVYDCAMCVEIC